MFILLIKLVLNFQFSLLVEVWSIGTGSSKHVISLVSVQMNECGMCYPVCGMVHIKEPLLLIGMSSPCGGSGFPLSLSKWSFTICLTPYNHK